MEKNAFAAKLALSGAIAAGTALWGWFGWLVMLWVACMVVDYGTGTLAALRHHDWSSAAAREGLWHKCGMILAVLVAALTDIAVSLILRAGVVRFPLNYSVLLTVLVLSWYTLTELGSTLENVARITHRVPPLLTRFLRAAADAVDQEGGKEAGDGHDA